MVTTTQSDTIWTALKNDLVGIFPQDVYQMWFQPLECLEETDDTLKIGVPNDFAAIWIQDNYMDLIGNRLQMVTGRRIQVALEVTAKKGQPEEVKLVEDQAEAASKPSDSNSESTTTKRGRTLSASVARPTLNPKNTFENFVVGSGNQLAHAASIAVSNAPGKAYNPLFLYGETGLGKTHLMHAVAHNILRNKPDMRVVYVSCEKFTNEFIRSIQENTLVKFRKRYRGVDVLLIDDIHFLSGKERIQEEFFHTFNELFESQRQIFLSSDRPASEISKLESRLVSRFQWGLVTDVQAPDFETRLAILTKKAASMNIDVNQDILDFLAQRVARNVRRMEGALTRVASYASLIKQPIDIPIVERLLQDILQEEAQNQITIEKIQKKVAEYYQLRMADMLSKRRPSNIAFPRQVAMYLSRMLTSHSLQEIGDSFGGRDHGTVIHACKTVENIMDQDDSVKRSIDYLTKQLSNNAL